jgi:hypothetical protein
MSGDKWNKVRTCVNSLIKNLDGGDLVGCLLFNEKAIDL